ncbi:MAG: T9SS type A sorting domain-containing protein [Lewinellaceae bacterium]|nr:T9SS type A sorting domain-containing protein [Lewinellaceae bacterium]
MGKNNLLCVFLIFMCWPTYSQTIWDGPKITFTKADNADFTLEENQDRITDNVWITRGTTMGIYNIRLENSYVMHSSPEDTEWAFGTTGDLPGLTFDNWQTTVESNPPGMVDRDMVLHLISEDIYIDVRFLSWSVGAAGGGFRYERSTDMTSGATSAESFSSRISLFPNPSPRGKVAISCQSGKSGTLNVSAYSLGGKFFYHETLPVNAGTNNWVLDLSHANPGIYLIRLEGGDERFTKKIVLY